MKNKILKTCFVSCLATCLTLTGIFAFAPLGASAQTNSNSSKNNLNNSPNPTTENAGLITPRADDPVLFTTESGLEIKYGNATIEGNMSSGNLAGFPYFTTSKNSVIYTWVIIAIHGDLAYWDPAAFKAIVGDPNTSLRQWFESGIKKENNTEIFSGSALCLMNDIYTSVSPSSGTFPCCFDDKFNSMYTDYATNDTFGFGSNLTKVCDANITLIAARNSNPSIVNRTYKFFSLSATDMFNYYIGNYLTESQRALGAQYYGRSRDNMTERSKWDFVMADGTYQSVAYGSYGIRPACVMNLY